MKCLVLVLIILCLGCQSKKNELPAINLLMLDSLTVLNTNNIHENKPVILMYFSPDCSHCQEQTVGLIKNIAFLKHFTCYLITTDPLQRLRVYNHYYHLDAYPNLIPLKDFRYEFFNYYKPDGTPYLIVYSKNKKLFGIWPGGTNIDSLVIKAKHLI